jgi:hypothetical protein
LQSRKSTRQPPQKAALIESEDTHMKTVAPFLAFVIATGVTTLAQEKTTPPPEKPTPTAAKPSEAPRPIVPLRVQIVLSRFKGDKKVASFPYTLSVTSNDRTNLRMGIDVPISSTPMPGYSYRSVGTNIDCIANPAPGDAYKLNITVEDSSIHLDPKPADSATGAVASDAPAFRTFKSSFGLVLRDGQSGQFTSAVDPISGEVLKIDVTLNVLK